MNGDHEVSVLVVDDDAAIRTFLRTILKRTNADVECVPDGDGAMERLGNRSYSVVILDLMLPTIDGFEVIRRVAETMPELLKRFIVLTAVSRSTLGQLDGEDRLWRVMRKPFDINDLLQSVAACAAQGGGSQLAM